MIEGVWTPMVNDPETFRTHAILSEAKDLVVHYSSLFRRSFASLRMTGVRKNEC